MTSAREIILGIDFGTSCSSAAAYVDGQIHLVHDGEDRRIPSAVYVPPSGLPVIGRIAMRRGIADPEGFVTSIKRILGHLHDSSEVRTASYSVGCRMDAAEDGSVVLRLHGQDYAPAQIVAMILSRLRDLAEAQLGARISRAVFAVPVAAPEPYRRALALAARIAHLEVVDFVDEPVAGVLAYGLHARPDRRRIAVCDFGGGTFDTTLVRQEGNHFIAEASASDLFLGGDDFDAALADAIAGHVYRKTRVDLHHDQVKWSELLWASESTKRALSAAEAARLYVDGVVVTAGQRRALDLQVSRGWIEPAWAPLVERSANLLAQLLARQRWPTSTIDELVFIGGTTFVPLVRRDLCALVGRSGLVCGEVDVATVVGAALVAAERGGRAGKAPRLRA